jgi:hypothetical protein
VVEAAFYAAELQNHAKAYGVLQTKKAYGEGFTFNANDLQPTQAIYPSLQALHCTIGAAPGAPQ